MTHITLSPHQTAVVITAGGTQLGKTHNALALKEGSYPPVLYIPRADVDMTLLEKTTRQTTCPHKGLCSYYSIKTAQGLLENAVWSYESPIPGIEAIAGHLAFYPNKVSVI